VLVVCYTFIPVPDVDFIKKTVRSSTSWTVKTLFENIVLIDIAFDIYCIKVNLRFQT
jgi:hypothetical protein